MFTAGKDVTENREVRPEKVGKERERRDYLWLEVRGKRWVRRDLWDR